MTIAVLEDLALSFRPTYINFVGQGIVQNVMKLCLFIYIFWCTVSGDIPLPRTLLQKNHHCKH